MNSTPRTALVLFGGALLTVVAVGCGGGDKGDSTSTSSTTETTSTSTVTTTTGAPTTTAAPPVQARAKAEQVPRSRADPAPAQAPVELAPPSPVAARLAQATAEQPPRFPAARAQAQAQAEQALPSRDCRRSAFRSHHHELAACPRIPRLAGRLLSSVQTYAGCSTTLIAPEARSPATLNASAASTRAKRCVIRVFAMSGRAAKTSTASANSRLPW